MDERQLREVFEQCDVGWVFDENASERAKQILIEMHEADRVFNEKMAARSTRLLPRRSPRMWRG